MVTSLPVVFTSSVGSLGVPPRLADSLTGPVLPGGGKPDRQSRASGSGDTARSGWSARARVDDAAGALLLQSGQRRRLGQPGEIELREARLELDGRVGRLAGDGLDRQFTLKIDADDPASSRPAIGLQHAAVNVGVDMP